MRRTRSISLLAATLALGAIAADGDPEDITTHACYDETADALVYPEQQVWFHEGESKIGTTDGAHPFDTTPPTASVTDGAGAGQYSGTAAYRAEANTANGAYDQHVDSVFTGTFTGCIDTLLVDVYSFDLTNRTSTGEATNGNPGGLRSHTFSLIVEVDGTEIFRGGPLEANTVWDNEGFGPNLNRVGVELGSAMELYADFIDGFELAGEHTVTVRVAPWFANTGHSVYVWDTTEVPSGLTFNGEITDDYRA